MAVRIISDSACDLPPAICQELGIDIVPLTIRFGEQEYVDRLELSTSDFWRKLDTATALPETAAPSVGAFEETFRRLSDGGADGIVCINLSSAMSATMQSAQVAAKALDGICPIEVVDSQSVSMGAGINVMHAARRARDGADVATIVKDVEDRRERTRVLATLDTLEFLRRGGRIGGAQAMLGSMLSIKPVITVTHGVVEAAGRVRTRSKALRFIVDGIPAERVETLCVMNAGAPELDEFLDMLSPITPRDEIVVGDIGPVVGTHSGPRALGVVWTEHAT